MSSVFQNADRYEDTLEHCVAELLMLKSGCLYAPRPRWRHEISLVCSKVKMEIPNLHLYVKLWWLCVSDANPWRMRLPKRDRAIADAWIGVFSAAM